MTAETAKSPYRTPSCGDHYLLRSFVAGGIASCCAKTAVAPLERIKILFQGQSVHYRHMGILSTISAVKQTEGLLGFYKGNGAMLMRIFPYGAIQFMAFDEYKKLIKHKTGKLDHMDKIVAGSMAGITAVIFTYPLDVVRARLAFQVKGEEQYKGVIHAFRSIYTNEGGFRSYYKGLVPTLIGMAPYAGLSFYSFESLKTAGLENAPKLLGQPSADNLDVLVLKTPINMLFGGLSGAISQTVVYPVDVARRRMQLAAMLPKNEKCQTMFQTFSFIYREHGVRHGLYRGLSINYLRCIPSNAVAFTIYEFMRQLLHLNKS
ncbi:solute carrier family 25 member 16-like [Rhinoderma darwinii]|uniref:solute carrier family 25 member 16-like n=1 Tax=Rhinoderma darwinii TaxID=43563 RepID=UPI003F66AF11